MAKFHHRSSALLCQRGPASAKWRALRGDSLACVSFCVCVCVHVSVSGLLGYAAVRPTQWWYEAPFVRSLIFPYWQFTSVSPGKVMSRGCGRACLTHSFLFRLFLQHPLWAHTHALTNTHSPAPLLRYKTPLRRLSDTAAIQSRCTNKRTLDLVVLLPLCSTQHHLWRFYTR